MSHVFRAFLAVKIALGSCSHCNLHQNPLPVRFSNNMLADVPTRAFIRWNSSPACISCAFTPIPAYVANPAPMLACILFFSYVLTSSLIFLFTQGRFTNKDFQKIIKLYIEKPKSVRSFAQDSAFGNQHWYSDPCMYIKLGFKIWTINIGVQ